MTIKVHLFLGYRQTKEFKTHLNQSPVWKEKKDLNQHNLTELKWEEQEYIGVSLPSLTTCQAIIEKELEIKSLLQLYCPKLMLHKHQFYIFPQLFIH